MARIGLAGPSYTTQNLTADSSRTINWYPEPIESGRGKAGAVLMPTPGLSSYCAVGVGPMRGSHYFDRRLFVISGDSFYELDSAANILNGTAAYGTVLNDLKQCKFASGVYQTLIISAGKGYVFDRTTNVLTAIASATFPGNVGTTKILSCGYVDGYFFVLADDAQYYISSLNDATAWAAIDTSRIEFVAAKHKAMIIDHRDVIIFMDKKGQALYNSGDPDFPFTEVPSGLIEYGVHASDSIVKMDNSIFMLGEDENGAGMALRFEGYQPRRMSDHGIEHQIQRYIKRGYDVQSTVGWSLQINGHSWYVLNIPAAETSLVYDASTKMWFEWAYWNTHTGQYEQHRAINHVYAFDKHLVGDRESGILYELDSETYTDNSAMIRRLRRHPHINAEMRTVRFDRLQVDMEVGVGLDVADGQPGYDPQLTLEYSDDQGKNFTGSMTISTGKIGETTVRPEFRDIGSTDQSRVLQLIFTDPVPARLNDAYLEVS